MARFSIVYNASCFMFFSSLLTAQTIDSTKVIKKDSASILVKKHMIKQFPATRPLNVEYTFASPYNFTSKVDDKEVGEGRVKQYSQLKASTNFNIITKKKWYLAATLGYKYSKMEIEGIDKNTFEKTNVDRDFQYHYQSLNFTYISKIFNKPIVYTAGITTDGSNEGFERIKGLATASMILKSTSTTKIIAGVVVNIDTSAQIPLIPMFLLEHKFTNGLVADVLLPSKLMLRKHVFTNGRLSIGSEMDVNNFYVYNLNPNDTKQKYEFRQMELNNGLMYEHLLGKYFIITAKTGAKWFVKNGLFEKEDSFDSARFSTTQDPTFYFNLGLSFNPFIKKNN